MELIDDPRQVCKVIYDNDQQNLNLFLKCKSCNKVFHKLEDLMMHNNIVHQGPKKPNSNIKFHYLKMNKEAINLFKSAATQLTGKNCLKSNYQVSKITA